MVVVMVIEVAIVMTVSNSNVIVVVTVAMIVNVTYCKSPCQLCRGARELGPRICPAPSAFQSHPDHLKERMVRLHNDVMRCDVI